MGYCQYPTWIKFVKTECMYVRYLQRRERFTNVLQKLLDKKAAIAVDVLFHTKLFAWLLIHVTGEKLYQSFPQLKLANVICQMPVYSFLPHDATHKRGLCRRALSVCPSVYSVETKNRNEHIFKTFFHRRIATQFWFSVPNLMAIFRRGHHNGGVDWRWDRQKSRFSVVSGFLIHDWWCTIDNWRSTVQYFIAWTSVYLTDRHASVNLVYHNQHGRPRRREQNRTTQR